jgi:hypothetical protein
MKGKSGWFLPKKGLSESGISFEKPDIGEIS